MITPFSKPLEKAVAELYSELGRGYVSRKFQTCECPVCMADDVRQKIIETPNWELSEAQICQYSNSAHGIPENLDDLRMLLPRYAELISQDYAVDDMGLGTELVRFGNAKKAHADFFTERQYQTYAIWGELAILHFGVLEFADGSNLYSPSSLFKMFILGGMSPNEAIKSIEKLFSLTDCGRNAIQKFSKWIVGIGRRRNGTFSLSSLSEVTQQDRKVISDWLNGPRLKDFLKEAEVLGEDAFGVNWPNQLLRSQGDITPG